MLSCHKKREKENSIGLLKQFEKREKNIIVGD